MLAIVDPFDRKPMPAVARAVIKDAAAKHGVLTAEILSTSRSVPVCRARHEAMVELVNQTNWSISRIGKLFGRDHTTVMHAINKRPDAAMTAYTVETLHTLVRTFDLMRDGKARTARAMGKLLGAQDGYHLKEGQNAVKRLRKLAKRSGLAVEVGGEPAHGRRTDGLTYRLVLASTSTRDGVSP